MPDLTDVPVTVRDLARLLGGPTPMRRGTLAIRYLRCNKPGCACADRADARHGPYCSVVRVVGTSTPASSRSSSWPSAKLTIAPTRPTMRSTPGDSDAPSRPNARSRGQKPVWHGAQW